MSQVKQEVKPREVQQMSPLTAQQCDTCAEMFEPDELSTGYVYGLETTACRRCCGEKEKK